jgi:hypothetical protein
MHWSRWQQIEQLPATKLGSRRWRSLSINAARSAPLLAAVVALLIYASTLANDLTWQSFGGDGGELATASMTLGIPHPPGYPLYVMLGRLFAFLPIGNIATRYSLFSAVAGSIAIGFVVHSLSMRKRDMANGIHAPISVGLALALAPLIWSQAIIVEVYALFLALLAFFTWTIVSRQPSLLVGLALGLSISGHLSALLLVPLALWRIGTSGLLRFVAGMLLGLFPFLFLPWLAGSNSPVLWGNPQSLSGWWWLVTARLYQPNLFALPVAQWPDRFIDWLNPGIFVPLFIWLGLALAGARQAWRKNNLLPVAFLATALSYAVYAFTYRTDDAAVLLLPAFVLAARAAGPWLLRYKPPAIWLLPLAMLLLAGASTIVDRELDVRVAATEGLGQIPEGAIVLTAGDPSISALLYFQHVEGLRQDALIVDENMFQFDWYRARLGRDNPELSLPVTDDLNAFIKSNSIDRPICRLTLRDIGITTCVSPLREAPLE